MQGLHGETSAATRHRYCGKTIRGRHSISRSCNLIFQSRRKRAFPRRDTPEFCSRSPSEGRGRREGRVPAAPMVTALNGLRNARLDRQVQPRHPDLPCAAVYSLYRALLGEPAFATIARAKLWASRELGACMGAPGPHDFAVRGSCRTSIGTPTSTAFRTTFVTIAIRP